MRNNFRAAIWIRDDKQGEFNLTEEKDKGLSHEDLLNKGVEYYRDKCLKFTEGDYCSERGETLNGSIYIGEWEE